MVYCILSSCGRLGGRQIAFHLVRGVCSPNGSWISPWGLVGSMFKVALVSSGMFKEVVSSGYEKVVCSVSWNMQLGLFGCVHV